VFQNPICGDSANAIVVLPPDFLCSLVAPPHFMRLFLKKAAHAVASSAAHRNIRVAFTLGPPNLPKSARNRHAISVLAVAATAATTGAGASTTRPSTPAASVRTTATGAAATRPAASVRTAAAGASATARTALAAEPAMSSCKAAASCLQSAAAVRDWCRDGYSFASVHNLFRHGEALQLGIETQWNALDGGQVTSPQPVFHRVSFHMRDTCPG
jgi:hypothetical protein